MLPRRLLSGVHVADGEREGAERSDAPCCELPNVRIAAVFFERVEGVHRAVKIGEVQNRVPVLVELATDPAVVDGQRPGVPELIGGDFLRIGGRGESRAVDGVVLGMERSAACQG